MNYNLFLLNDFYAEFKISLGYVYTEIIIAEWVEWGG